MNESTTMEKKISVAQEIPMKKELTEEQKEKKRAKNKARAERKKAAKKVEMQPTQTKNIPQVSIRKTREEREKESFDRKLNKIERSKDTIVTIAETNDAKDLAFKVEEISVITKYIRDNYGLKIPFEDAQNLLTSYYESTKGIEKFIEEAHSIGIGSFRALKEYKKEAAKKKVIETAETNKLKKLEKRLERSRKFETPAETKERETLEKQVQKATDAVQKAQEAIDTAMVAKETAENELKTTLALELEKYEERIQAQLERLAEKKAKETEENNVDLEKKPEIEEK